MKHSISFLHTLSLCVLLCGALGLASGCDRAQEGQAPVLTESSGEVEESVLVEPDERAPEYRYSPFVVQIRQGSVFRKISFKDVGISHTPTEDSTVLYETIAESLSMELSQSDSLMMSTEVSYDEDITDPSNHLACGSNHLYVDVWRSDEPERWGYSLWSGCGDEDNFAWREVSIQNDTQDPAEEVAPLTRSIVESLVQASQRGCYQKAC